MDDDERTWLLDAGAVSIKRKVSNELETHPAEYRLAYFLWVADYGMTNAGDLDTSYDLDPSFLDEGRLAAIELGLPVTIAAFSLMPQEFEQRYFEFFANVVREIKARFPLILENEGNQS